MHLPLSTKSSVVCINKHIVLTERHSRRLNKLKDCRPIYDLSLCVTIIKYEMQFKSLLKTNIIFMEIIPYIIQIRYLTHVIKDINKEYSFHGNITFCFVFVQNQLLNNQHNTY